MADEANAPGLGQQQPEVGRGLETAAQSGSKKPDGQSTSATPETAPQPGSLEDEEHRAAGILKEGAERATHKQDADALSEAGPAPSSEREQGVVPDPSL